jgi:hypothetical protein
MRLNILTSTEILLATAIPCFSSQTMLPPHLASSPSPSYYLLTPRPGTTKQLYFFSIFLNFNAFAGSSVILNLVYS